MRSPMQCFDIPYYREHNPDLQPLIEQDAAAWKHYTFFGQFERRPHRWVLRCVMQAGQAAMPPG